jgi:hypothetical protein
VAGGRREKVFGAAALLAFVLSLGHYTGFYRFLPFVNVFRFPAQWLLLAVVFSVLVAASAFERLRNFRLRMTLLVLLSADFFLFTVPLHTTWGDSRFSFDAPRQLMLMKDIPPEGRVFHADAVTRCTQALSLNTQEDWIKLMQWSTPSLGVSYGVHEVSSRHQLPSKRLVAFVSRLETAPASSPLFDAAGVQKIITVSAGNGSPCGEGVVIDRLAPKARVFSVQGNRIDEIHADPGTVSCRADGPGEIVLSESWFPGWKAFVDGNAVPVSLFEETFPKIAVPAGRHDVLFRYRPLSFFIGGWVTGLTLLFSALLFLIRMKKHP